MVILKHSPSIAGVVFALISLGAVTGQISAFAGRAALWGAVSALVVLSVSLAVAVCHQRQARREAALKDKYDAIISDLADATLPMFTGREAATGPSV